MVFFCRAVSACVAVALGQSKGRLALRLPLPLHRRMLASTQKSVTLSNENRRDGARRSPTVDGSRSTGGSVYGNQHKNYDNESLAGLIIVISNGSNRNNNNTNNNRNNNNTVKCVPPTATSQKRKEAESTDNARRERGGGRGGERRGAPGGDNLRRRMRRGGGGEK